MQIINIIARRQIRLGLAQYEHDERVVELSAKIGEDDDPNEALATLTDAIDTALATTGHVGERGGRPASLTVVSKVEFSGLPLIEVPAGVVQQPFPETPSPAPVIVPTVDGMDQDGPLGVFGPGVPAAEPAKRTRRTKAEMEAARAAEAAGAAQVAQPAAVVAPTVQPVATPPATGAVISDADLTKAMGETMMRNPANATLVTEQLKSAGIPRVAEMPQERRAGFLAWLATLA